MTARPDPVGVLRVFRDDYAKYIPQFHAANRHAMKETLADLDAAIEALSAPPHAPVAWLAQKIGTDLYELAEPNEKASNPQHWTDGFPVYRAPPHAPAEAVGDELLATDVGEGWLIKAPNGKEIFASKEWIASLAKQQSPPHAPGALVDDTMVERAMDADAEEYGASIPASRVRRILSAALNAEQAVEDGWIETGERLPGFNVPVWGMLASGHVMLTVRDYTDEGWSWCNTYGNVSANNGKWGADDAEWDDDYQVVKWHALPDLPAPPPAAATKGGDTDA